MAKKKRIPKPPTWRNVPDHILIGKNINGSVFDKPESLHPSENTMIRYCDPDALGHGEAVEIIHSYLLLAPTIYVEALP
jgi:hypothetical protein